MTELPRRLSLELTARCNYACPFCYGVWHERPELAGPELGTAEWTSILDECARRGVEEVQFTGGEPLLREDLDELIDRARAAGLKTAIYTNASLFIYNSLFNQSKISNCCIYVLIYCIVSHLYHSFIQVYSHIELRLNSLPMERLILPPLTKGL